MKALRCGLSRKEPRKPSTTPFLKTPHPWNLVPDVPDNSGLTHSGPGTNMWETAIKTWWLKTFLQITTIRYDQFKV